MNRELLPVHRAIERATASGARAELLCKVVREHILFSVALTSLDPAPTVSIRLNRSAGRASDMLLGERDQFGPESWDYPARVSRTTDGFVLRLTRAGESADVPVLSAAAAVLMQQGWAAKPGDTATAIVVEEVFVAALDTLGCSEPSTPASR